MVAVTVGCGEPQPCEPESVGQHGQAWVGSDVQSWPAGIGAPLWLRAVPKLSAVGSCGGIIIQRDVILTAGHCVCEGGVVKPGTVTLLDGSVHVFSAADVSVKGCTSGPNDLAIITLHDSVSYEAVPEILAIRTGRFSNLPPKARFPSRTRLFKRLAGVVQRQLGAG